ncbi:hypothetical protein M527_22885 [Sphingobium indicum IP26]|uniref:Bacteriophage Mu GpT domain-containing protein n=3 Tax=Sphingomonadaceae TaxID=41297 RepID=A0A8E0WSX5_9SPHN|nr:hypothetical protein M527_22885 [Sphingobium indicum IP26]KER36175.1 hypothetical protein AL00_11650 [Sphingobium indicum F2]KER36812.1 hypothetical protein AL00_08785 [Sphingobium indicum F2]
MTERRVMAAPRTRSADISPTSWNAESRTIEVVWTTGARGARFDWESFETVDEELDTRSTAVRLDRLNAGAPVLDTHRRSGLANQIGAVVPGSARMQNGQGVATVRLSDRPDIASIVSDIASGIIRNLSVGYMVHVYEIERAPGQRPLYRAVDWEPFEISFVPVPFDAQAQVRDAPESSPCILRPHPVQEYSSMSHTRHNTLGISRTADGQQPATEPAPITNDPVSLARIREYVMAASEGAYAQLTREDCNGIILDIAERGMNEHEMRETLLGILASRQRAATSPAGGGPREIVDRWGSGSATYENPNFHARAIEDALYARMSGRAPTDQARAFMHMSLVQIAGQIAERAGVRGVNSMAPGDVLNAAAWNRTRGFDNGAYRGGGYHTASDFPDLLTGAGQRFLMDMFAAAESPLKLIGRRRNARDFREISGLELSGFGTLSEVLETGEIKSGTFKSRKETYQVKTFAKMFALSRQAIINDDLGAFGDPIRVMARAAGETEASLLASFINNNPAMSDSNPLFNAEHGNLAGTGAAPSVATLSDGRLAMRSQKDLDGVTPIAAAPKYILSSPSYETAIEQLIATQLSANQVDEANPFAGKLTPLVDPRLDALPWYLFADPVNAPVLEYAYLEGHEGPRVEMKEGWDTLGTSFRVYMDFGAGLVDWRGAYKNPGAVVG